MVRRTLLILSMITLAVVAVGYFGATATPIIRSATVHDISWPTDSPPLRIALLSDIHIAGPDMPPERLATIVAQINAAKPDLVLIAGDFVSDKRVATRIYPVAEALAPLKDSAHNMGHTRSWVTTTIGGTNPNSARNYHWWASRCCRTTPPKSDRWR